jgi:hypothetical protein
MCVALGGIATGRDVDSMLGELAPLHPKNNTFPGEVFLELAADALEEAGVSRSDPVDYEGIRERYLAEVPFRGRSEHHRSHYALGAAAMIRAGLRPDLLGEVIGWSSDNLWVYAFFALVIYLRVAAARTGRPVAVLAQDLAARHGVVLTGAGPERPAPRLAGAPARVVTQRGSAETTAPPTHPQPPHPTSAP